MLEFSETIAAPDETMARQPNSLDVSNHRSSGSARNSSRLIAWIVLATLLVFAAACGGGHSSGGQPQRSAKSALYLSTGLSPNSILTYVFDSGSSTVGSPTPIAGPPAGIDMKIYPGGKFLYVSDFNSGSIFAYSINQSTGALTALSGSPFVFPGHSGNGGPIAIDPAGKFLYSSSAAGAIVSFTINSQTGVLMPSTAQVINDKNQPMFLLVHPSGKFLIASNHADSSGGGFSVFSIDSTTAVLTAVSGSPFTFFQNTGPEQIVLNSTGTVLYAALSNSKQVAALDFDSTTGRLTIIQGSPYPAGLLPQRLALLPSGAFLYAGNNGAGTISEYAINASTGALTHDGDVQVVDPTFLDINASGQFLLIVGESSNTLSVYKIDATNGSITLSNNTNLPAGSGVRSVSPLLPLQ
jgi:6-phosphogluconolactonase